MKQITAYQIASGEIFTTRQEAEKAASKRHADAMALMRLNFMRGNFVNDAHRFTLSEATHVVDWIENNFLLISGVNDLKRDLVLMQVETEEND